MKRLQFERAVFLKTAMKIEQCPDLREKSGNPLPEIAMIGRSNVGKSTLLNALFGRKKIAHISSTPGKTQGLNFYLVDNALIFTDLPGYGYAKVPTSLRKQWGSLMEAYLQTRKGLRLLLFLLDIRRNPTEEDLQFVRFARHYKRPFCVVLTKVDKVTPKERRVLEKQIYDSLEIPANEFLATSGKTGLGKEKLLSSILHFIE